MQDGTINVATVLAETDLRYIKAFADHETRRWGTLFWNLQNPDHYDANHAHIDCPCDEPNAIVDEIVAFYRKIDIVPRIYLYDAEANRAMIEAICARNFKVTETSVTLMKWDGQTFADAHLPGQSAEVRVERVHDGNFQQTLEVECAIEEFGGREIREVAFPLEYAHPGFFHYLLTYKGEPASTVCLFSCDDDIRMETVATMKHLRGHGLISQLIGQVQRDVQQMGKENLWVIPVNEQVERLYQRCGFLAVGHMRFAICTLE